MKNAKNLKRTNIFIRNDFSRDTLRKRRCLWDKTAEQRKNGARVRLINDKVKVDSKMYYWDDAKEEMSMLDTKELSAE